MPYRTVRTETTARLVELQSFHRMLVANEISFPVPIEHAMLKGHFIVGLYAYIEFSLEQIIRASVAHVNSLNVAHKHLSPEIFALASAPKFMAASDSRGEKRWDRRREIVTGMIAGETCIIADSVLSNEIQNTRRSTVELVFNMFAISADPIATSVSAMGAYINEVGERRNAVAHGRESAADVGGRYSVGALQDRLSAFELQTTYMISCFEDAAARKGFIRPNCRRFYP